VTGYALGEWAGEPVGPAGTNPFATVNAFHPTPHSEGARPGPPPAGKQAARAASAGYRTEMGRLHTPAEPPEPPADWWPVFFAAARVRARNIDLAPGDLFIVQRKSAIRDYLMGFEPRIDTMPLHKVKMLKMLCVPPKAYTEIIEKKANFETAVAILKRRTAR
jgi:hypothetical protein